jgi:hypothetical protein
MSVTDSDEPDDLVPSERAAPPDEPGGSGDPAGSGDEKLEVTGVQVAASTLASVSAAGVASLFGVHGTVIGAGVASVIATVGAAVYQRGLDRTSARLQQAPVAELVRPVVTRTSARLRGERFPEDPGFESWKESSVSSAASRPSGWRSALAGRRWGVSAGVGLVLVATLAVLFMVEVAAQRPLSGDDRGATSIGAVVGGGDSSSPSDDGRPDGSSPSPSPSPSPSSSPSPSPSSPSSSPSSDGATTTSGSAETEPDVDSPTTAPDDPDGGGSSTTAGEDPPSSTAAPESEASTGSG